MKTAIFIKTWKNDLEWFAYCMRSVRKYVTGFDEVVVVCDEDCRGHIEHLIHDGVTLHYTPNSNNGYMMQQVVKLATDEYTTASHIVYVDSDNVFFSGVTPASFMYDGKPKLYKTAYAELNKYAESRIAMDWQQRTASVVGWQPEYEYMRILPSMYLAATLKNIRIAYPELPNQVASKTGFDFSEFNVMGAFIDRYEQDAYHIIDTVIDGYPIRVAAFYWSYGGVTPAIKDEIEGFLR